VQKVGSKAAARRIFVTNAPSIQTHTKREELLSLAEEAGHFGVLDWEVQTGKLHLSPNFISIYGLTEVDLTYEQWLKCILREDIPQYLDVMNNAFSSRQGEVGIQLRIVRPIDGEVRWIEIRTKVLYDDDGQPIRVVGIGIDVPERRRATVELRDFTEALEEALRERTQNFESQYEARKKAEKQLRLSNLQLDAALNNMRQGVLLFDSESRLVLCNQHYLKMYGLSPDTAMPGCTLRDLLCQRIAAGTFKGDPDRYIAGLVDHGRVEAALVPLPDGRMISVRNAPTPNGGWVSIHDDVTEQRRMEQERDRSQKFLNTIVENAPIPIFVKEASGLRYVLVNRAGETFWGTSRAEMVGKTAHDVFAKEEADLIAARDEQLLQSDQPSFDERQIHTPRNGVRNIVSRRLTVCEDDGKSRYVIGVIEDVTERKLVEKRIAHMAHHDALTDLPNRLLLRERLEQELTYVRRGGQLAVLYLDLDHFKSVNDTLGHSTGDALLKAAADRLRGCLRDTDFIARLGGDEFAIIQTSLEQPADAAILAQRLRDQMIRAPFELNSHQFVVDMSVGIALAPHDSTDVDQLLRSADMALYGAKSEGRGTYRFFEPQMDARMKRRRALELDLRKALVNGEFQLYYHPIVSVQNNQISCCEALLRWHHPERGMIPPEEFIPVAEETGLMVPIGEWVLRHACSDAAAWPTDVKVAVNISPVQLRNETWSQTVVGALLASGLSPLRLELEITESVLMQNNEATLRTLHWLRQLGVRIAMDDFGTGYSSLSYLRSFPFDKIKIDRSFVGDLLNSADALKIVQAIASLASGLNMITTAEGVETERQLEIIRAAGCTEMQGYLFSPPRPAAEILRLILPRALRMQARLA
jgi:diguanylate cyclase (GGDEF)-like protein/PAS domain S-box-containing protein